MTMAMAFARLEGSNTQWQMVTLNGLPCASERPVIEFMVEKMQAAFPGIEYVVRDVQMQQQQ